MFNENFKPMPVVIIDVLIQEWAIIVVYQLIWIMKK